MGSAQSSGSCCLCQSKEERCEQRADRLHQSELYARRAWVGNVAHVERLLKRGTVAPFGKGLSSPTPKSHLECLICYLVCCSFLMIVCLSGFSCTTCLHA